jgi:hypothetical protein
MIEKSALFVLGLSLAVLAPHGELRADLINVQYAGSASVTITSSGDSGTFGAGPFNLTDTTTGQSLTAFCVDLHTTVNSALHSGLSATVFSPLSSITNSSTPGFSDSAYNDVGNRLAYAMGSLFASQAHTWDSDELGAFQAALWHTIDKNFSLVWANSHLMSDYNKFVSLIGPTGSSGSSQTDRAGNVYAGFQFGTTYGGGELFWMDHQGSYQNLIAYDPNYHTTAVPEPSTMSIALVSVVGLVLYRARRRGA